MTSDAPVISVVIPTYNSEAFIAKTIESVLNQDFDNFELVVSDDGSSDGTIDVIESTFAQFPNRKTKLLKNQHAGPGATRNSGVEAASGEWISFLDSDDLWKKNKLSEVYKVIQKGESDIICHSEVMKEGESESILDHGKKFDYSLHPFITTLRKNAFSPSSTTMRRKHFLQVGGFDTSLPSAQDFDLWLRVTQIENLRVSFIEDALGYYIIRGGSISSDPVKRFRCIMQIGRKYNDVIQSFSPYPLIERMRYSGIANAMCGRQLILKQNFFSGFFYFLKGMIIWPRLDWLIKVFKKTV